MPETNDETPKLPRYPAITIAELRVVKVVLDQIKNGGAGAQERAATIVGMNPSMVSVTLNRVEAAVGQTLVQKGRMTRRRPLLTYVGEEFRHGIHRVLDAWQIVLVEVGDAVERERNWQEEDRERNERDG